MTLSPVAVENFGGLNLARDPGEAGWSDAIDLLNVEIDQRGRVRSRDGYAKFTATAGATQYDSIFGQVSNSTSVAYDDFSSAAPASALNARVAPSGGTWATSGDATDYTRAVLVGETRATTSESTGRLAVLGATSYTDHTVRVSFSFSSLGVGQAGLLAREVDTSNYLRVYADPAASVTMKTVKVDKVIAGVATNIASGTTPATSGTYAASTTYQLEIVLVAGVFTVNLLDSGGNVLLTVGGSDSTLAAAGTLQTGKPGMFDRNTSGSACTRTYYSISVSQATTTVLAGASGARLDALNATGTVTATVATASDTRSSYAAVGSPSTAAIYIANSGTTIRKFAAAAFSTPAGMPKAKFVALQSPDNRLFAANVNQIPTGASSTASTSLVHVSGAGTPETWGANDFIYLSPGDGEDITGMVAWRELVFVFKSTRFFVFHGNSTDSSGNPIFNYRPVTAGIGLAAARALAPSPNGLYFLDRRGIYLTTGGPPQRISSPIDPLFTGGASSLYTSSAINASAISEASMTWFNDRLYIGLPLGGAVKNDHTLVYDPETQQWVVWDTPFGALTPLGAQQPPRLLFTYAQGTNNIGQYAANGYTDDAGTAITSRYRAGFADLGSTRMKTVREWILDGIGSPTLQTSHDFGSLETGAAVTLGTSPAISEGRRRSAVRGRQVSWQVGGTTAWTLNSLVANVREQRPPGVHSAA